ncbi:hypothetical protein PG990_010977 [Apiospora arundinis]
MTWKTTHPSPTSSIPSSPSSRSSSCSTTSLEGATVYLSASPGSSSGADTGGGGGMDEGLKLGLGLGIGIGIPLMTLLGFGCFLLWRLLRKICPIDFRRSATSSDNAEKQHHRHKKTASMTVVMMRRSRVLRNSCQGNSMRPRDLRGKYGLLSWEHELTEIRYIMFSHTARILAVVFEDEGAN